MMMMMMMMSKQEKQLPLTLVVMLSTTCVTRHCNTSWSIRKYNNLLFQLHKISYASDSDCQDTI